MLEVPEVPVVIRCVLLRMLEVMEGVLCVLEVMRCVLLRMLEVVEGVLCLLEASEVMRSVIHCMLEAVEGVLCSLEDVGGAGGYALWALFVGGC